MKKKKLCLEVNDISNYYKFLVCVLKDITKLVGGEGKAFSAFPPRPAERLVRDCEQREAFTILVVPKGWAAHTHTLHLMETRPYLGRNMH